MDRLFIRNIHGTQKGAETQRERSTFLGRRDVMNTLTFTNDEYDELRELVQYAFNTHYCTLNEDAFDTLTDKIEAAR